MVRGKKGILRLIEAVIAILIVIGVLVFVSLGSQRQQSEDIGKLIPPLLDEIAKDNNMRRDILSYKFGSDSYTLTSEDKADNDKVVEDLKDFVGNKIEGRNLAYELRICSPLNLCHLEPYPSVNAEIYASERVISTDIGSNFEPRKVKIFLWRE